MYIQQLQQLILVIIESRLLPSWQITALTKVIGIMNKENPWIIRSFTIQVGIQDRMMKKTISDFNIYLWTWYKKQITVWDPYNIWVTQIGQTKYISAHGTFFHFPILDLSIKSSYEKTNGYVCCYQIKWILFSFSDFGFPTEL